MTKTLVRMYAVHSCVIDRIPVKATMSDGREVDATVTGLTVELVPDNGVDGEKSQTETFIPEDMAESMALFAVGNLIKVEYSLHAAAPPKEPVVHDVEADAEALPVADVAATHIAADPAA